MASSHDKHKFNLLLSSLHAKHFSLIHSTFGIVISITAGNVDIIIVGVFVIIVVGIFDIIVVGIFVIIVVCIIGIVVKGVFVIIVVGIIIFLQFSPSK